MNFQIHFSNIIRTYQSEDIYSMIYGIYSSSPNSLNIISSDNNKCNVYLSWNSPTDNGEHP